MRKLQPPLIQKGNHTESSKSMNKNSPPCRALPEPINHPEGYRGPKRFLQVKIMQRLSQSKTFSWSVSSEKSGGQRLESTLQSGTGAQ
jgi:hypothetical protein